MAKGTTAKILGGIRSGIGHRGKQFGVDVELTFADGRKKVYCYTRDRKKDVVTWIQSPVKISQEAEAARLDECGRLSFVWCIDFRSGGGMRPAADGE